ncbi:Holliday junction resolvase RuvX [Corynebacterium cystitidis]|uniref:Holliday junction resolvase RuvX n=1 Tax=Corynebacterium cystitidis TaxID=35757 RepID=UPI00211E4CF4|nr:Holliday junction resolvase RuvX [Corynebacterium cystitidis]
MAAQQITHDIPGVDDPGPGRRIGIDVGTVRMGVASSNREATLATPVETVPRVTGFKDRDQEDIDRLLDIIKEYQAVEIVVGLPRTLKGHGSASVKHAKEIAFRINRRLGGTIPVRLADERLTTVVAHQALRASGVSEKAGRAVVDQAAAVEILQSWLDGRATYLKMSSESKENNS